MISLKNVSLNFGDRILFDEINLTIKPRDKFGFIGKNGEGKTTLFKTITKEQLPDTGKVEFSGGTNIGHLKQHLVFDSDKNVKDFVMSELSELNTLQEELEQITEDPGFLEGTSEKLLNRFSEITELMALINPAKIEAEAEKILKGLGFKQEDFVRSIQEFSGGWQMRMELAKMLLCDHDYLLLDEPTNFLDIESIVWLENYLRSYPGAFIIISHDKDFLDNTTTKTLEISLGSVYQYAFSYTRAIVEKEERIFMQNAAFENQQKEIQHKEKLIDKFRAKATKANFAKSLQKELARMDVIEREVVDFSKLNIQFMEPPRSGDVVISLENVGKSFDTLDVFSDVNLSINRGEKIALVGRNGEGKSTLVNIITDKFAATKGEKKLGHNVEYGYFAQNQADSLDPAMSVLEYLEGEAPPEMRTKVRSILGAFMFSGEDVDKKTRVLSGGERSRLALAGLLLKPYNLLILDEPTNHLDIPSKGILKKALEMYTGTVFIISHDRFFLRSLTEITYEMRDGGLHEYLGDIDYFLDKKGSESIRDFEKGKEGKEETQSKTKAKPSLNADESKKLKKKLRYVERDVEKIETEIKKFEVEMAVEGFYQRTDMQHVIDAYNERKVALKGKTQEWEELVESLEE